MSKNVQSVWHYSRPEPVLFYIVFLILDLKFGIQHPKCLNFSTSSLGKLCTSRFIIGEFFEIIIVFVIYNFCLNLYTHLCLIWAHTNIFCWKVFFGGKAYCYVYSSDLLSLQIFAKITFLLLPLSFFLIVSAFLCICHHPCSSSVVTHSSFLLSSLGFSSCLVFFFIISYTFLVFRSVHNLWGSSDFFCVFIPELFVFVFSSWHFWLLFYIFLHYMSFINSCMCLVLCSSFCSIFSVYLNLARAEGMLGPG